MYVERIIPVYRRFCWMFAGITASILMMIAILSYSVDPYDVWLDSRSKGINLYAIRSENRERLFKPIRLLEDKPDIMILGNSKSDFAINPEYLAKITGEENVYNMSTRNGMPYEFDKYVENSIANNRNLKTIILALDYEMFVEENDIVPGFDIEQVEKNHITLDNAFKTMLSWDSIKDSLITLKMNHDYCYDYPTYEKNGKLSEGALHITFDDEASFYKNTRKFIVTKFEAQHDFDEDIYRKKMYEIEHIVKMCEKNGVDLKVIVLPVHAIHLDAYSKDWDAYGQWVKDLSRIVPFTSFNQYNYITTESIDNSAEDNQYFWDSVHIKQNVGNMVLDYIYANNNEDIPENFAFYVDQNNADEYLADLEKQRQMWEGANRNQKYDLKCMGRFVKDCPSLLENSERIIKDDLVDTGTLTKIQWKGNSLYFEGKLNLEPGKVLMLYAMLENENGDVFYAMANKKWRKDDGGLSVLLRKKEYVQPYEFLCGAITEEIPEGVYDLKIMSVVNDNKNVYVSPSIQKVEIAL